MSGSETTYTARFPGPEIIEAGRDNIVTASIYLNGGLVAVTSGTLTVWNASNTKVVDAAAVTVTASVATYTITSVVLTGQQNSDGWRFEWALVIGGATRT